MIWPLRISVFMQTNLHLHIFIAYVSSASGRCPPLELCQRPVDLLFLVSSRVLSNLQRSRRFKALCFCGFAARCAERRRLSEPPLTAGRGYASSADDSINDQR